jgi:hypothetical protein
MSALAAQRTVAGKANVAVAAVGAWLINYNSVEAILLFCAVLVTLAGIMFETGQLDSEFYEQQRDVLASAVLIVMIGSILYFAAVLCVEVRVMFMEAKERDEAPIGKLRNASMTGGGLAPASDGGKRARRYSFGISRLAGTPSAVHDEALQAERRSSGQRIASSEAPGRARRQSISEMSGIELSSYLKPPSVLSEQGVVPAMTETVSNPMFASMTAGGASGAAPGAGGPGMAQHKELAQNILLMQGLPNEEQWSTIQELYGDMVGMVAGLQEQVKGLKREVAQEERAVMGRRKHSAVKVPARPRAASISAAPGGSPVANIGPPPSASTCHPNGNVLSGQADAKQSGAARLPDLSFAAGGNGAASPNMPPRGRRRSISATRKILSKKAMFGQEAPSPSGPRSAADLP